MFRLDANDDTFRSARTVHRLRNSCPRATLSILHAAQDVASTSRYVRGSLARKLSVALPAGLGWQILGRFMHALRHSYFPSFSFQSFQAAAGQIGNPTFTSKQNDRLLPVPRWLESCHKVTKLALHTEYSPSLGPWRSWMLFPVWPKRRSWTDQSSRSEYRSPWSPVSTTTKCLQREGKLSFKCLEAHQHQRNRSCMEAVSAP
ncbi:hypothetical protein BDW69DRAFT_19396 [Aspergillus filifer]